MARPILLVSVHYPPSTESGARRPWELVGTLRESGRDVHVLTAAIEGATSARGVHGETIVRVAPTVATPKSPGTGEAPAAPPSLVRSGLKLLGRAMPALRRQYIAWKQFPDEWRGIESHLVHAGLACKPSLVYSTSPSISAHIAARVIARHHGVPWVAEFRDPWGEALTGRSPFAGTIKASAAARIRRMIVEEADLHVAVSEGIARWLADQGATNVLVARNGIPDRLLEPADRSRVNPSTVAYFGEFYLDRTPEPLFRALASLRESSRLEHPVALELVGNVQRVGSRDTSDLLREYDLDSLVQLQGRIPHEQVMEQMRSAGLLLLLAQKQPDQVPNKLYEYLAAGRPILAWVDEHGESASILRTVGGHFLVTENTAESEATEIVARALRVAHGSWAPASGAVIDELRSSTHLGRVVSRMHALRSNRSD